MKSSVKSLIIILCVIAVGFGVYILIDKVAYNNGKDTSNTNSIENVEVPISSSNAEKNVTAAENKVENTLSENSVNNMNSTDNKELKKITISDEEMLDILIDADPFEKVDDLSTDKKLAIVYNALNESKISAYKDRGNGKSKVEYTEGEINGIIFSLFGVKLSENKSYGKLEYKDGKYVLERSDKGTSTPIAKNIEGDVAAGTAYTNYDLYYKENGKEVLKGSYAIGKSNVTGYVTCKKEM